MTARVPVPRQDVQRRKHRRRRGVAGCLLASAVAVSGASGPGRGASVAAQEPIDPTPIEHALVEYFCRITQGPAMIGTDAYQACYARQLAALREPLGRDLSKLSAADRRSLDAKCRPVQAAGGRDPYLECLYEALRGWHARRTAGKPGQPPVPAPLVPAARLDIALATTATPAVAAAPDGGPGVVWWIAGAALLASAGTVAFVVLKKKSARHACRECGADVAGSGELCAECRHLAAEARRRALVQHAEDARAHEEQIRRETELQEEERRRERERREEALRLRAMEEQRDQARRLRAAPAHEAESQPAFHPYVVLGLTAGATADEIRAAYDRARARYDAGEYEHLGDEVRTHFRAKAAAVERAYEMLLPINEEP